jgi:hypothetical protein
MINYESFRNDNEYLKWRRRKAIHNIIIIVVMFFIIATAVYFTAIGIKQHNISLDETIKEFSDAVKVHELKKKELSKIIPLNSDIINTCVNGKKVIIVNGKIYYHGTVDTWGDIKGVDCEE